MGNFKGWAKYARTILALSWLLIFWKGGIIGCAGGEEEVAKAIHAVLADSDSDGLADQDEIVFFHTDPAQYDMDGDGLSDGQEICYDNNCLDYTDGQDTNPNNPDTDGDGYLDGWEAQYGFDPLNPTDPSIDDDSDRDGIPNEFESNVYGTDPNNADTDGDGYPDKFETDYGSDPLDEGSIPNVTKVVINEFFAGTCTWVELYNVGSTPVDLSNWTLRLDLGLMGVTDLGISAMWGSFTLGPREFMVLDTGSGTNTANHRYQGSCSTYCDDVGSLGSFALIDGGGTAVDFVRWGGHWPFSPPDPPPGTSWSDGRRRGDFYNCPAGDSLKRDVLGTDTDTGGDWSVGFAAPGRPNSPDSDGDGLSDWEETNIQHTDPGNPDTDGDGYPDGLEVEKGANPTSSSSRPSGIMPEVEPNGTPGECTTVGDLSKKVFGQLYPQSERFPGFFEDFSDGNYTDSFRNYSGGNAAVQAIGGHDNALCAWNFSNDIHLFTQQSFAGDMVFEFDYYLYNNADNGGVFFRATDTDSGFRIAIGSNHSGNWEVQTRSSGKWFDLTIYSKSSLSISTNQWHHYKIVAQGNRYSFYQDDIYRGFFFGSYNTGGVGLRGIQGSGKKSCIDNIRVTSLPLQPDQYFDDFSDGNVSDTFQNYLGASVQTMGNHATALCYGGNGNNNIHIYTQNQTFADGVFEFDYYLSSGHWDGGVFFRVQDPDNGYLIALRPTSYNWNAYSRVNGGWYGIPENNKSQLQLQNNQWFHYKIIMEGDKFTLFENGENMGSFQDSRFAAGAVGLRAWYQTGGQSCIDSISVTPLPQEYADNFSDGVYDDTFQNRGGGSASIQNIGGQESALCASEFGNSIHFYTKQSFQDGLFEFDYYLENGPTGGGVYFRARDADNGYGLILEPGSWQAGLRLDGNWHNLNISNYSALQIAGNEWRHYKLFMDGGRFDLYEDGSYRGSFSDGTFAIGGLGLRGRQGSSQENCVDNIRMIPGIPDTNYYCFHASAGQFLGFDIDAYEWGSPVDTILNLYDTDGTTLLNRNDDGTDPETSWDRLDSYFPAYFPAGGNFYLSVQGSGWGREAYHPYELQVRDVTTGDADGDGLSNGDEINIFFTDPFNADSDGDGLTDYFEINYDGDDTAYTLGADTDPNNPNTDGTDGSDGEEVANGTDPLDPLDPPVVLFSQFFNMTGYEHCASWNTFRSLLGGTYTLIEISGTYDPVGVSCSGPTANLICQALQTGASGSWFCDGRNWYTGDCAGGIELSTDAFCNCGSNYAFRPCLWSGVEGGVGMYSCTNTTQTMSVWCSG